VDWYTCTSNAQKHGATIIRVEKAPCQEPEELNLFGVTLQSGREGEDSMIPGKS